MITSEMRPGSTFLTDHSLKREIIRRAFDIHSWSGRTTSAVVPYPELILVSDIPVAVGLLLITFSLFSIELLYADSAS